MLAEAGDIPLGPPLAVPAQPLALFAAVRVALVTEVGTTVQATGIVKVVPLVTVTTKVPLTAGLKVPPVTPAMVTESPVVSELARVVVTTQEGLPRAILATMVFSETPKSIAASVRIIWAAPAKIVVWFGL